MQIFPFLHNLAILLFSEIVIFMINSCRPIRSVIILVINKSASHCAVVRFCYHLYDYRPNWTPLSPITIYYLGFAKAFDSVCYQRILFKLKWFGIGGPPLRWFESCLIGCMQRAPGGGGVLTLWAI